MNEGKFVRKILKDSGLTRRELCKLMGWKNVRSVNQIYRQRSISVLLFWRVCNALGYEIVVRPKNYLRLVEGEEIIESENGTDDFS